MIAVITAANADVVPPSTPEWTPSRVRRRGNFAERSREERQRVGAGHRVIHEARRQQLPSLGFVVAVLAQRLANNLGNSAVRLTVQDQRVDRASDTIA